MGHAIQCLIALRIPTAVSVNSVSLANTVNILRVIIINDNILVVISACDLGQDTLITRIVHSDLCAFFFRIFFGKY